MAILADHEIAALCAPDFVCKVIATRKDTGEIIRTFRGFAIKNHENNEISRLSLQAFAAFMDTGWLSIVEFKRVIEEFEFSEEAKTFKPMIEDFVPNQVRTRMVVNPDQPDDRHEQKILSYGLSGHGYDVTLAQEFRIFTNINTAIIDPLHFDEDACLVKHVGEICMMPPNSYILGHTREVFNIPEDIMVVCLGKSTYARAGGLVNVTPIEAGFSGTVVIEVGNSTNLPLKVYADQGIAQFLFFRSDEPCDVSYALGNRKYQGQRGIVVPKV